MVRIGILGGTFSPIHWGHLWLAETARETLTLDRVLFVPTGHPPHKRARGLLPGAVRLEMVQLAIRDQPAFVASDIELQRPGVSFSVDTVKAIHGQLPQAQLFLLVGQDMLAVKWAAWEEITAMCTVVAARRPGQRATQRQGVQWLQMPQIAISSSEIRDRIRNERSVRYLLPPAVERYIREHHLYASPTERP